MLSKNKIIKSNKIALETVSFLIRTKTPEVQKVEPSSLAIKRCEMGDG